LSERHLPTRDEFEAEGIRRAQYWVVRLFLGSGQWHREDHLTREAAEAAFAALIGKDKYGRKPSLYAVAHDGRVIHVK
jgi:hypothetical protein